MKNMEETQVVVVVVANFARNVIIEINNVIMKIKWRGRGR
jgi:hypothetical protein